MKKYFLLFAIIFISSGFWNSARSDDGTGWTYDPVGLITDVGQLSDNCEWSANMLINMIDNSYQTHFHSNPSTDLRQTDEWIQVKLPYAMQNIKFTMSRRRDGSGNYYNGWNQLPNNVDILVSDDGTTWTKVTNVSQPDLTQSSEDDFASYVDLGGEFQYVRFVVRGTVDDNGYFNISEMQIYKAVKAGPEANLKVKLNDLKTATVSFLPGTDPGFYATDPYNALIQAFNDADALLAGSHSDAEYTAMIETLQNAYTACVNSKNAMHD
ncbi:MAG: discoidin domain-containing protein, partial [Bacteroidaceae bacterium]|nr:discoidin domain-containing protein [Bacteroidaceae bacterium]